MSNIAVRVKSTGERLFNRFIRPTASDYKAALLDLAADSKSAPLKAFVYSGIFLTGVYAFNTNPTNDDFTAQMVEASNSLLLLSDATRNKVSDEYIQKLMHSKAKSTISHKNYWLFSVIYQDKFDSDNKFYQSQCKHLKRPWYKPYKDVVDIGLFGKWWNIKYKMADYDINFNEWPKDDSNSYLNIVKKFLGISIVGNPLVPLSDQVLPEVILPKLEDYKSPATE